MDLLPYIPIGRRNALSRFEIAMRAGCSERTVRSAIAGINETGRAKVIADPVIGGYYIPKFPEDATYYRAYMAKEHHRIQKTIGKLRAMDGHGSKSKNFPGQYSLFGGCDEG